MTEYQFNLQPSRRKWRLSQNAVGTLTFILFLGFAFIAAVICLGVKHTETKQWLVVIPAGYALVSAFFFPNFRRLESNMPKFVVQALYFIRLVILPLLYTISGVEKLYEGARSIDSHFTKACFLMVYEYLAVQLTLWVLPRMKRVRVTTTTKLAARVDLRGKIIALMTVYLLLVGLFFPEYGINFKNILQLTESNFTVAEQYDYDLGTMGRIVHTLFSLCLQLVRVLLPALLMQYFYRRKAWSNAVTAVLMVGCILQFFFLTSTFAEAIVATIVLILYYVNLYPERVRKMLPALVIASVGVMSLYFGVRFVVKSGEGLYDDRNLISHAAAIINAYFTGIDNVSAALNVPKGMEAEAFRADVLGAIPFNTTLFGSYGNKFQHYFNLVNASYGQIPPTIGACYYYLGAMFSPLFTAIFVAISQYFNRKAEENKESMNYVPLIFCSIVFALGTVMYSFSIALQWFFSWGLLMLIITKLTTKTVEQGG